MKARSVIGMIFITVFVFIFSFRSFSQNCEKEYYGDFDYRSQSGIAVLSPGDTSKLNVVIYSKQDFRIFICYDDELGPVKYRIIRRTKITNRKIKEIKEEVIIMYKQDEYGNEITDENTGEKIEIGRDKSYDTIYQVESYTKEDILFDSEKNSKEKPYWEISADKTERLIVEVIVPTGGDKGFKGEVETLIGRRPWGNKKFTKY